MTLVMPGARHGGMPKVCPVHLDLARRWWHQIGAAAHCTERLCRIPQIQGPWKSRKIVKKSERKKRSNNLGRDAPKRRPGAQSWGPGFQKYLQNRPREGSEEGPKGTLVSKRRNVTKLYYYYTLATSRHPPRTTFFDDFLIKICTKKRSERKLPKSK